jgi:hypothetical protein
VGNRPVRTFVPGSIETANGSIRVFVPEMRASELEQLIREQPGALTIDLAVRAGGHVSIQAPRIDGEVLGLILRCAFHCRVNDCFWTHSGYASAPR